MKFTVRTRQRHREICTALLNPQTPRSRFMGLNLMRPCTLLLAILQRSQPAPMQGQVSIRGVSVEALPHHQHRLAMLVHPFADKGNVRRQRHVTRNLFPYKLKPVPRKPHVLAASSNRVAPLRRVELHGSGVKNGADVSMALEQTDRRGS